MDDICFEGLCFLVTASKQYFLCLRSHVAAYSTDMLFNAEKTFHHRKSQLTYHVKCCIMARRNSLFVIIFQLLYVCINPVFAVCQSYLAIVGGHQRSKRLIGLATKAHQVGNHNGACSPHSGVVFTLHLLPSTFVVYFKTFHLPGAYMYLAVYVPLRHMQPMRNIIF